MQKLGFAVRFKDWMVQNIVATGDVGFPIRLEGMADDYSAWTSVRLAVAARARVRGSRTALCCAARARSTSRSYSRASYFA